MRRVGILLRANEKGLGAQSLNAWSNFPFDESLLVLDRDKRVPEHPEWYPDVPQVCYQPLSHTYEDKSKVIEFVEKVDVVFAVETLYDWSVAADARVRGIRTVVQGNPEFYRAERDPQHQPSQWTWPTSWLIDRLPEGPVVPVPVPSDCWAKPATQDDVLTVVHVAGHRAAHDRNGTDLFVQALRFINHAEMKIRIYGQDNTIPELPRIPTNIEVETYPLGVLDRWQMYDGAHILVMPRRYGGLCLPVQEAMTAGLAVAMTDVAPNPATWPIVKLTAGIGRQIRTPLGAVPTRVSNPSVIAGTLVDLAKKPDKLFRAQEAARVWAYEHTWDKLRYRYHQLFEEAPL